MGLKKFIAIIIVILLIISLIAGWFYWFQWRPTKIKKVCYKKTFERIGEWVESNKKGNKEWSPNKEWMPNPQQEKWRAEWGWWYPVPSDFETVEVWHAKCLLENGLKAEILITPKLK